MIPQERNGSVSSSDINRFSVLLDSTALITMGIIPHKENFMQVALVKLADIASVDNTRGKTIEVAELMASIKKLGLMQPICVANNFTNGKLRKKNAPKYVVAAGNRRLEAFRKLGKKTIPVIVNPEITSMKELMIVNLSENIQREDVSVYEQGRFVWKLVNECELTVGECASKLGITVHNVRAMLSAYKQTPKEFRNLVVNTHKSSGPPKKNHVPISMAHTINDAQKSGFITKPQAKELYKKVATNVYTKEHLDGFLQRIRKGRPFKQAADMSKRITYINVRIPIFTSEKDKFTSRFRSGTTLKQTVIDIVYGEKTSVFTRPKF